MAEAKTQPRPLRFGNFELDLRAGELRRAGVKLKLSGQPFQLLTILLEHAGEVVTREELREQLWPDTFVDFDHSLNKRSIRFERCSEIPRRARASSKHCLGVVIAL